MNMKPIPCGTPYFQIFPGYSISLTSDPLTEILSIITFSRLLYYLYINNAH